MDYVMGHPDFSYQSFEDTINTTTGAKVGAEFNAYDTTNYGVLTGAGYPNTAETSKTVGDVKTGMSGVVADTAGFFVGYDCENTNTPNNELTNATQALYIQRASSISLAAQTAHNSGLVISIAPGMNMTAANNASHGQVYASKLSSGDIFIIQGETALPDGVSSTDISGYTSKVLNIATAAFSGNPNVLRVAELSTQPTGVDTTLSVLQNAWNSVSSACAGVTVFPSGTGGGDGTLLRSFVNWFVTQT